VFEHEAFETVNSCDHSVICPTSFRRTLLNVFIIHQAFHRSSDIHPSTFIRVCKEEKEGTPSMDETATTTLIRKLRGAGPESKLYKLPNFRKCPNSTLFFQIPISK